MRAMTIGPELREQCPAFAVGLLRCEVRNSTHEPALWEEIASVCGNQRAGIEMSAINTHPEIAATRDAYRKCGKDPNRYRPSAEALRRRIVKGQDLYRVSTLVDIVNLVSLRTGHSIGAFDDAHVQGDLRWGIGRAGEPYEGIGRGPLNIEGMPVVRDEAGPIGTPTSDEERTKLGPGTTRLLLNMNSFSGPEHVGAVLDQFEQLLTRFAGARAVERAVVAP